MFGVVVGRVGCRLMSACCLGLLAFLTSEVLPAQEQASQSDKQPTVVKVDLTQGMQQWNCLDDAWKLVGEGEELRLSQFRKKSNYEPKVRSPRHIALLKGHEFESFVLDVDVLSTHKDYNHRDVCLFFGFQGPSEFYYVHLGKKMDPHANQIFIVNQEPRTKISTTTTDGTDWDDQWHHVRIRRDVQKGTIEVFFDDMQKPVMTATDKTFAKGQIGFGSFDDTADFKSIRIAPLKP